MTLLSSYKRCPLCWGTRLCQSLGSKDCRRLSQTSLVTPTAGWCFCLHPTPRRVYSWGWVCWSPGCILRGRRWRGRPWRPGRLWSTSPSLLSVLDMSRSASALPPHLSSSYLQHQSVETSAPPCWTKWSPRRGERHKTKVYSRKKMREILMLQRLPDVLLFRPSSIVTWWYPDTKSENITQDCQLLLTRCCGWKWGSLNLSTLSR